jgi:serine/threonine protein kinase
MARRNRYVFPHGTIVGDFQISGVLGQGGFGDVYLAEDQRTGLKYALKTEYLDAAKQAMENEIAIFRRLRSAYVPQTYAIGATNDCRYFVMDVLGSSLSTLRLKQPTKTFPRNLVVLIAEETLHIIEEVHSRGVVHRDIKPSNFLLKPHSPTPLVMIDFGISKIHIDQKSKKPFPPENGRFVGTSKYASPNALRKLDLGRIDDIYSWFYMCYALAIGKLTWANNKDKDQVLNMNESIGIDQLYGNLPTTFIDVFQSLSGFGYYDRPDYERIYGLIKRGREEAGLFIEGTEWKWLWDIDYEGSGLVPRTLGDEQYDRFDPQAKRQSLGRDHAPGCCSVA